MTEFDEEIINDIMAEVVEQESEANPSSTVVFTDERNDETNQNTSGISIRVSRDELLRLKNGEMTVDDIVSIGGMTDAFVEETVTVFITHASEEMNAQIRMREEQDKYEWAMNDPTVSEEQKNEIRQRGLQRSVWPHEKIVMDHLKDGDVEEFMGKRLSYLTNHTMMQLVAMSDALRKNINYNKRILLDAKSNGFEFSPEDKRSIIANTIMLEELYNQHVNLLFNGEHEVEMIENKIDGVN